MSAIHEACASSQDHLLSKHGIPAAVLLTRLCASWLPLTTCRVTCF